MPNETELERMIVRLQGDGSGFQKTMKQAQDTTKMLEGGLQMTSRRIHVLGMQMRGYGATAAAMLAPIVGIAGATGSVFRGVSLASEAEAMEADFGTMLMSLDAGQKMVEKLQTFAAETPLSMMGIQSATKMLLQFDVAAEDVIPTLKMLGDVAGGDQQRLMSLALAFGQAKAAGRLMGGELMQMRGAGFNPLMELVRTSGKELGYWQKEMEGGRVGIDLLTSAFVSATSEGGRFKDGMLTASKTLKGLFSTMQDDMDAFMRSIGFIVIETFHLKDGVKVVSAAAQRATDFLKGLSGEMKGLLVTMALVGTAAVTFALLWPFVGGIVLKAMGGVKHVILALVNPVRYVTALLAILGGTVSFLITPVGLMVAAISALLGLFVLDAGGIEGAWEVIKDGLREVWEELKPLRDVVRNLFQYIISTAPAVFTTLQQSAGVALNWISQTLSRVYDLTVGWLTEFITNNRKLVLALGITVTVVVGLTAAFKVLRTGLILISSLLALLRVKAILMGAVWLALKVALFAASVALNIWTVATTAASLAMQALSAIASVLMSILSVGGILVIVAAVGALITAAMALVGAFDALYSTADATLGILLNIDQSAGPINHIKGLFVEWKGILSDIFKAMQTDMPLAMKMMEAAWTLGIAQMKALWPPLWAYLRGGFEILWDTVKILLIANVLRAFDDTTEAFTNFAAELPAKMQAAAEGGLNRLKKGLGQAGDWMTDFATGMERIPPVEVVSAPDVKDELSLIEKAIKVAEIRFGKLGADFKVVETDDIKAAREELNKLRAQLGKVKEEGKVEDPLAEVTDSVNKMKNATALANKEVSRFDAAVFGSLESLSRLAEYRDRTARAEKGSGAAVPGPAALPVAVDAGAARGEAGKDAVGLLTQIRDLVKKDVAKPVIVVEAAELT